MTCSPENLAANRKNSLRSTGPRTFEGKERSRQNGLKHGLTGAGVVVPDEDVAAIEGRFEAFQDALKPRNDVALALAQRAALLAVRMERSARHEAAEITREMLNAEGREADERAEEFRRLTELITSDPAEATRKLRRIPEGVDWMIGRWESLRVDLIGKSHRRWDIGQSRRASELLGHKADHEGSARLASLTRATMGQFQFLDEGEWAGLPEPQRREAARAEIRSILDGEIARLQGVREGLDHQAIDRERAGARARALFSTSREAILARKYEAAAERGFFRALKQIELTNSQQDETDVIAVVPSPETTCAELASSLPETEGPVEVSPRPDRRPRPSPQSADRVARDVGPAGLASHRGHPALMRRSASFAADPHFAAVSAGDLPEA